jgi:trk system potassium uptake protein TrkA
MKALIVGGGKITYFLARTFLGKGYNVTVINRDRQECVRLGRRLKATIVCAEGSDPQALSEAGAGTADAVLAVTPNDEDNLAICQLSVLQFSVPRTLALVNDPDNEEVFRKLGISAFSAVRMLSHLIEQQTALEEITNVIPAGGGQVNVTEVILDADSPVVGKPLHSVALPSDSLVACVVRSGRAMVPRGATQLREGDRVMLISLPSNHGEALKALTGHKV